MTTICEGRIIYTRPALPDPQGNNGKSERPWVIINTKKEIERGNDLIIVASTTLVPDPLLPESPFVLLPWGRHNRSGLSSPSVAHCGWIYYLDREDVSDFGGLIEAKVLDSIRIKVNRFLAAGGIVLEWPPA